MTNINKYSPHCEGKQSSFVSSDNGCKHEGKNSSHDEVRQFKVDGEVFPKKNPKIRCDWLLLNDTKKHAYYIELKGSDIPHAIEQIESTIKEISPSISEYKQIYRRIIYKTGTHKTREHSVTQWKSIHRDAVVAYRTYTDNL